MINKIVEAIIKIATAIDKHPMAILPDFCKVLSGGNADIYSEIYNDVHKILYAKRHTIPWLIESS